MVYNDKQIESLFSEVLKQISEEGTAVRTILKQDDMPSSQTFFKWLDEDEDKSKRYARACEIRTDNLAEEMLEIADDQNADAYIDDDGKVQVDGQLVQRAKLMVDTRKWLASKLNPKKYGEKNTTVLEGTLKVNIDPIEWVE